MTGPRRIEPRQPETGTALETVRVSSGKSARLGAIAVAGLLVAVVWIAVSGQSAVPQVTEPVAAIEPTPDAPAPTPGPVASAAPRGPGREAAASSYRFSVVATFGSRQFITPLEEDASGNLAGSFPVPLPLAATEGTLEFSQLWVTVSHEAWATIGSWPLGLESISGASRREQVVLDASMRPRRNILNAPPAVVRGFRITVHAQREGNHGDVWIDIQLGPRGQLAGNDGIFGWPVVAQLAMPTPEAPSVSNGCHWNGRPPPSRRPPWPTYDETSCS